MALTLTARVDVALSRRPQITLFNTSTPPWPTQMAQSLEPEVDDRFRFQIRLPWTRTESSWLGCGLAMAFT